MSMIESYHKQKRRSAQRMCPSLWRMAAEAVGARAKRSVGLLLTAVVASALAASAGAEEQRLGTPVQGLQGSIVVEREVYRVGEPVSVTVTLTNVSDAPIEIDPWPGNWFVQVFDEKGTVLPPAAKAEDVTRPMALTKMLQPGETWSTQIEGLRLVTGLPGSTPLWEYRPLKPGVYLLGAEYIAMPSAAHPNMWMRGLNCKLVQITVAAL